MRHQYLLIRRLAQLLQSRMTGAGHLAQVVTQEHRGNCSAKDGCTPGCLEAQALLLEAEPFMPKAPLRMTRRARAVPGRVLPSGPARGRASRGAAL
jgi:hypothetical protein